jgi:hypothetical protein
MLRPLNSGVPSEEAPRARREIGFNSNSFVHDSTTQNFLHTVFLVASLNTRRHVDPLFPFPITRMVTMLLHLIMTTRL